MLLVTGHRHLRGVAEGLDGELLGHLSGLGLDHGRDADQAVGLSLVMPLVETDNAFALTRQGARITVQEIRPA